MAEKRMFTLKIVDSDAFLDMPLTTQALYFHLNMRADDDGFVNNPKKIQRMIGASEDDLKLLIAKRFILTFENGVIVIKHWRMHNLLRKDRYTPTQYQDQMAEITLKENGAYTERCHEALKIVASETVATIRQPDGNQMATQDRIGKDRIGKDREEVKEDPITCKQVVDLYHSICKSYPAIRTLSEARRKSIKARLRIYSLDDFRTLFAKAEASQFLKGSNDRNWSANFDWLIKDANMAKVIEGNYDDRDRGSQGQKPQGSKNKFNNFEQRHYDTEELVMQAMRKQMQEREAQNKG